MNILEIEDWSKVMLENLPKNWHETENFLTNTLEKVTNSTQDSIATGQNSLNQGFKTIMEKGNSAISKINEVAAQAKDTLTKVSEQSIEQVNLATNQALEKLTQTADQAQASFNETVQNAEKLSNMAVAALQQSLSHSLTNWLDAHPILAWSIAHPLVTLVLLLFLWLLFGGLLRAIARLSEQIWLTILKSPFKLAPWLFAKIPFLVIGTVNSGNTKPSSNWNDNEERLASILKRLEAIKREQDDLWLEMTTILALNE